MRGKKVIGDKIIYFFNCYYLFLGVDETFDEVIDDFVKTESEESINEMLKELKLILDTENDEYLDYILNNNNEVNTSKEKLLELLDVIYFEILEKITLK